MRRGDQPPLAKRFVAIDTEGTGLGTTARICAFSAVFYDDGREVAAMSTLINPECPIPAETTRIHGITDAMVTHAPTFDQVAATIAKAIEGKLLIGHSIAYDIRMLRQDFARVGLPLGLFNTRDTCPWARSAVPELENHKLGTVAKHFGVKLAHAHNALADARAAGEIALALDHFCQTTAAAKKRP